MSGQAGHQQYCLKWNNHQNNMMRVFTRLLSHQHFTDVILAAEGRNIKCHKVGCKKVIGYFFVRPDSAKQVVVGGTFLFQFLFPISRNPKPKRQWLDLYNLFQMVLSACSSYFEQLFVNFSEPNQIVILKDTSFLDISAIVDFMYRGEINVSQVKLDQ